MRIFHRCAPPPPFPDRLDVVDGTPWYRLRRPSPSQHCASASRRRASGRFDEYAHDDARPASLAWNDTNALALDRSGGLWAGTWPSGLDYLAPARRPMVA
ncbi:MAG TPA: hypothetical protein VGP06_00665 [Janthinobacterium sp.]|nr:hypothetical protein [Janthinobacterium sp.]